MDNSLGYCPLLHADMTEATFQLWAEVPHDSKTTAMQRNVIDLKNTTKGQDASPAAAKARPPPTCQKSSRGSSTLFQSTPEFASLLPAVPTHQNCRSYSRASIALFQSSTVSESSLTGTAHPKPRAMTIRHDVSPAPVMRKPVELPGLFSGNCLIQGISVLARASPLQATSSATLSATTMTATTTMTKIRKAT